MRRIFTRIVLAVFLAGVGWPPAFTQQDRTDERQRAVEFTRLLERLSQTKNLEEKIALGEQALAEISKFKDWPPPGLRKAVMGQIWFGQGHAYHTRPAGDRADNLERAISAYEAALTFQTRELTPREWAGTLNNLGAAYEKRILGDRADNVEKAIAIYEGVLAVATREAMPREWARTQINLGNAYRTRIRGDTADNIEKAITACEAALMVFTREANPSEWATTQNNLGIAYEKRIRGDRADNLEKSIAAYEAALRMRNREVMPREWAMTQNNLGVAYLYRIRGDQANNLEKAIAHLEVSLTVNAREASLDACACAEHNLGIAYEKRILGDRSDNLEKAIAYYEAALKVRTREARPLDWAASQHELASAYRSRVSGDQADNLEKAIAYYKEALKVRTREALPLDWASTLNGLGNAYQTRIHGDRADNIAKAIVALNAALTVYKLEALPRDHLRVAWHLGSAFLKAGEWQKAGATYASAREAFLLLFGQGFNEAEARDVIAEAGPLFAEAAFAAAQVGESEKALALTSEGRARLTAVALKLQSLDLPAEKRQRFHDLRAKVRVADRTVEAAQGAERAVAVEKLVSLRQELLELVKDADAAGKHPGTALAQAGALAAKGGAVVVPIVTKVGSKILIVTGDVGPSGPEPQFKNAGTKSPKSGGGARESDAAGLTLLDLPELTTDRLTTLMRGDGKIGGWLRAYSINYLPPPEHSQRLGEWHDAIAGMGPQLWHLFGAKLDAALKEAGVKSGARLVWLPSGVLGVLPLGLAQDPASTRRLADSYEIVYAPSLAALSSAQRQISKAAPATLAAIINPTEDLAGAEAEGTLVASHFPSGARTVLERTAATPDAVLAALKGKTHWHFASHGTFSWADARQSALVMHGQAPLSVGRLLDTDGLGRPRLVVLSACETGLYDIHNNPDEFIGLPGTFTALGAAGVLGTLWPVDDHATWLLIAKFYDYHMGTRLAPPTALAKAQAWLRAATSADLSAYAKAVSKQGRLEARQVAMIERALTEEGLARSRNSALVEWIAPERKAASGRAKRLPRPYAHPFFWAGFIYTGL